MGRKVCFFVKLRDRVSLQRELYAHDIRSLREMGFDVTLATRPSEIRPADFYFIWWWTWAAFPLGFAKLLNRPALITGVFDAWYWDRRPRWHQALHRFAFRNANANVFISRFEYQQVPQLIHVNNPYYVPLAVEAALYQPGDGNREPFIFTLAWVDRINATRKCVPEIIKAAPLVHAVHPHIRFIIAGEGGTYHSALVKLAGELGASGYVDLPIIAGREAKTSFMQKCTLYLQPSRFEGFGQAILEAMSCGAPVVSSPVGAVPEVVGDTACLVDGTSPEAIANAINHLLDHNDIRSELGVRSRARAAELYPYERRKNGLKEIIEALPLRR